MSLDCKWDLDRHTSDTVNYLKLSNGRVSFLSLSHFVSKAHSHEQHTMAKHLNLRSVNFLVWLRVLKNFRRPSICCFWTPVWLSSNIWSLMFGMSIVTWRLIDWYSWLNVTHWNSPFFQSFFSRSPNLLLKTNRPEPLFSKFCPLSGVTNDGKCQWVTSYAKVTKKQPYSNQAVDWLTKRK